MASQALRKISRVKTKLQYALCQHILQLGTNVHDTAKTLSECKGVTISNLL